MAIDALQNKIRKMKSPGCVVLSPVPELIPPGMTAGEYCCAVLRAVRETVPAVRVNFGAFAMLGGDGLEQMKAVLTQARELGYYVILDWLRLETPEEARYAARVILTEEVYPCDAVNICGYAGGDCIKPYIQAAGTDKDVFVVLKTANKSAAELQDLQTGGRLVHTAGADFLSRWGETSVGRSGYSRVAAMAGAYNASSVKALRQKYPKLFLLVDGVDATGANAKNASAAFDKLGHGALCCAGNSILGAWKEAEEGTDPITAAAEAVERLKRNLTRYVTIL